MEAPYYKSEECSEMTGRVLQVSAFGTANTKITSEITSAAMITTVGTTSSMMDSTLQMITQQKAFVCSKVDLEHCVTDTTNAYQDNMLVLTSTHTHSVVLPSSSTANHSIYHYFSSTFQVASLLSMLSNHFSYTYINYIAILKAIMQIVGLAYTYRLWCCDKCLHLYKCI